MTSGVFVGEWLLLGRIERKNVGWFDEAHGQKWRWVMKRGREGYAHDGKKKPQQLVSTHLASFSRGNHV